MMPLSFCTNKILPFIISGSMCKEQSEAKRKRGLLGRGKTYSGGKKRREVKWDRRRGRVVQKKGQRCTDRTVRDGEK